MTKFKVLQNRNEKDSNRKMDLRNPKTIENDEESNGHKNAAKTSNVHATDKVWQLVHFKG